MSWAHYLRLGKEGLGIGFGWPALGRLDRAAAHAFAAGRAMAGLITDIHAIQPRSAGPCRRAFPGRAGGAAEALQHAPMGSVETLLLLSGAEYRARGGAGDGIPRQGRPRAS